MHAAAIVERILSQGKKSSTYKLALLRAIVDHVIQSPTQEPKNGMHFIGVVDVARRVLGYYWKPALEDVWQNTKGNATIPGTIVKLRGRISLDGWDPTDTPDAGLHLTTWMEETERIPTILLKALLDIRETLLKQPFQYIPNLGEHRLSLFSMVTSAFGGEDHSHYLWLSYDEHRRRASQFRRRMRGPTWHQLLKQEGAFVVLSARAYEELSELRYWLRDAIVLRWVRECAAYNEGRNVPVSVDSFELTGIGRDNVKMSQVRALYNRLDLKECLYTHERLTAKWDLDHVLPVSRFPVNLFWNLVPSHPDANRGSKGKFDKVPQLDDGFLDPYRSVMHRVVEADEELVRLDLEATYRRYFQSEFDPSVASTERLVEEFVNLLLANQKSLVDAGVEVWRQAL